MFVAVGTDACKCLLMASLSGDKLCKTAVRSATSEWSDSASTCYINLDSFPGRRLLKGLVPGLQTKL